MTTRRTSITNWLNLGCVGTIGRAIKGKTRKDTQLNLYKVMAVPVFFHGSEVLKLTK